MEALNLLGAGIVLGVVVIAALKLLKAAVSFAVILAAVIFGGYLITTYF